jgi:hypothetical protein
VPITLSGPKDEVTRVKLDMTNVPLADVIRKVAELGNLETQVEGEAIRLKTKLKEPRLQFPISGAAPTIPGLEPVPQKR